MTKRKRYSAEFKAKLALEAIHEELTTAEQAKKYGVHPTMIGDWKKQALSHTAFTFGGKAEDEPPLRAFPKVGALTPRQGALSRGMDKYMPSKTHSALKMPRLVHREPKR